MTLDFLWEKKGIMAASVQGSPIKAESLPDRFSLLLRECVAKSLAYQPKDRYSAPELLSRVRRSSAKGAGDENALAKAMEGFGEPPISRHRFLVDKCHPFTNHALVCMRAQPFVSHLCNLQSAEGSCCAVVTDALSEMVDGVKQGFDGKFGVPVGQLRKAGCQFFNQITSGHRYYFV